MNTLPSATDIVQEDLEFICRELEKEFKLLEGKKLLLIGGAGFLGYYLVQSILHLNTKLPAGSAVELTVYDNFIRGVPDWLTALEGDATLTLVKHDITHPLPEGMGAFDYIIHAASIASPTFYRKYPIETMDANVNGLRLILDYCMQMKDAGTPVSGLLYYSTSEIYGDPSPENIPTPESYRGNVSCTGPRACYDESKRYGETLCVNFAQQHGVPVRIARPFNNYGPGLKITDKRVLPDFARDVLAGRDIIMLSDGKPTRTFCYIADAIVGYFKILLVGRDGESYNIGIEQPEISMAELADRVVALSKELFGYTGQVVKQDSSDSAYLVDNPNRRCPVIDKARDELGYDPKIGPDEGLRRALIWYNDNSEAEEA
ncbi:NAD-dependent epimerase/dehydratase family protein [Coraliomargarita parva]|uniref:NAD-dependent epimerase/dehydratase family protein n=1 Tax=Coraliomargarita parva TaxID=3014050 RepID=UPI0022B39819|nr:NAD-dependent epimerase/dehydratase family protein [Coraliomargarita parva]